MLAIFVNLQTLALLGANRLRREDPESGQATAEYALVLLGAAAIALLVVGWATKTNRIGKLFDFVLDQVVGRVH